MRRRTRYVRVPRHHAGKHRDTGLASQQGQQMSKTINTYAASDAVATAKRLMAEQDKRGIRAIDKALDYASEHMPDTYMYRYWMEVADAVRAIQSYAITGAPYTRQPT